MEMKTTENTQGIQAYHQRVYSEADRTMHKFIIGYFILGILLSEFNNTWTLGLGIGGAFFLIYFLVYKYVKHKPTLRYFISFLLWNYPLQFILQMNGMYEVFFFYFISLTALLFYEKWKLTLPTTIYSLITVGVMYYLQQSGFESTYLVDSQVFTNTSFAMHIGLVIFYAGLCILWSKVQAEQTSESAINQVHMEEKLFHMEANIKFADDISQGELKAEYQLDDTDNLGNSLMNMRNSLLEASIREEKERFTNVGLATVGEILRNNVNDLTTLCDQVISELVTYMQANQGGIFILTDEESDTAPYLELIASRAFDRKKYQEKKINIGQGLVGQAYLEKQSILINDVPDNYISITSGMGQSNPKSILIVPLKSNEDIVGVIELASFKKFSSTDIAFLEKVGESIASTVLSAKVTQKTIKLLEESEMMTEQMQAQEEEMRQNMEELQATQEEMDRTQGELKANESNMRSLIDNTKDTIFSIDTNYIISIVNATLRDKYKGLGIDLKPGTDILGLLPPDKAGYWKARYDRSLKGEAFVQVDENKAADGSITFSETHHNPIKNEEGQIAGVSVIARDITAQINVQNTLKDKETSLNSLINNTKDSIIAIDNDYKVIVVNETVKTRYKGTQYEGLNVGTNALDMLGKVRKQWKGYYDRALKGEKLNFIIKSSVDGESSYREYFIYPISNVSQEIAGCSVFSREVLDHIDESKMLSES
jgi:methyl-accepting chemotaxis protein